MDPAAALAYLQTDLAATVDHASPQETKEVRDCLYSVSDLYGVFLHGVILFNVILYGVILYCIILFDVILYGVILICIGCL